MEKRRFRRAVAAFLAVVAVLATLASCASAPAQGGTGSTGTDAPAQPAPQPKPRVELTLDGSGSERGVIDFTLTYRIAGEFALYFADENGILTDFPTLTEEPIAVTGTSEGPDAVLHTESFTDVMLPPGTSHIAVCDTASDATYLLAFDSAYALTGDAFVFAALSDVHYNRYDYLGDGDDGVVCFDAALDFLDYYGVDLVALAGDISNGGEWDAFQKYRAAIADREYPVYSCTGNHDVSAVGSGLWAQNVNTDIKSPENAESFEVAANGIDFVYKPAGLGGDVIVFLSQVKWQYGNPETDRILEDAQLVWLEGVLEKYQDRDVYLFFHTFLCGTDGEGHTGVGNLSNGKYEYDLPYTYGAADEVAFRALLQEYRNVMYFSGHSHWMFEMDVYNPITNFSNFDGEYAYMIHIPSVTEPRYIGPDDSSRTSMNGQSSQGWIVYDYGDTVVLLPVEFTTGAFLYEYMEIIQTGERAA